MSKGLSLGEGGNLVLPKAAPESKKQDLDRARAQEVGKTQGQSLALLGMIEGDLNKPIKSQVKVEAAKSEPASKTEAREVVEKPKYKKVEYRDPHTGYKVTVHVPEGKVFNPKADKVVFYFPGDGGGNGALEVGKPGQKMLDKLPTGFYAVVSGGALKGGSKYAKFDLQGKAWDSLQQGMKSTLGVRDNDKMEAEMWGFSRGGNALSRLLASGKVLPSRVVILDACRQPLGNIVKYAARGGKVDLTYAVGSSVQAKDNFIIGLKKIGIDLHRSTDGSLVSADGRIKIFARFKHGHGAVLADYVKQTADQPGYRPLNPPLEVAGRPVELASLNPVPLGDTSVADGGPSLSPSSVVAPTVPVDVSPVVVSDTESAHPVRRSSASRKASTAYAPSYSSGSTAPTESSPIIEDPSSKVEYQPEKFKSLDKAFAYLLSQLTASSELASFRIRGKCEQYSNALRALAGRALTKNPGFEFSFKGNFNAPILSYATKALRKMAVRDLTPAHFADLPIGAVFFGNRPNKYGDSLVAGTDNKLPKIADKRHWWTLIDRDEKGNPIFADNVGDRINLASLQRSVGDRVILNVYDPYAELRERMRLDANGQIMFV